VAESHKQKMDKARPGPAQHRPGKLRIPILIGAVAFGIAVAAGVYLWSGGRGEARHAYALAPESALPDNIRKAPPKVREAYRFAIANRAILRQIPCFCGCGAEHQSNAECYIKEVKLNGEIIFDPMSFG